MNVLKVYENLVQFQNKKLLFDNKVIDALQFLTNAAKKLRLAEVEINALTYVNNRIKESYDLWNKELLDNGRSNLLPSVTLEYFGTIMSDDDANEKITGSFFHYLHSFFDNFAQFINTSLLANKEVDINKASFAVIRTKLRTYPEYSTILKELENFSQTTEFQYIEDFNNINKHQYTIDVQCTLTLKDGHMEQEIPEF